MLNFWKKLNEIYYRLVIVFFGFIMVIGIWQICDNYYIYNNALDDKISEYKPDPNDPDVSENSPITEEMKGWITIYNTNIDYPIMQGSDNSYFLNVNPFGEYSLTGSIFLDSRCSPDFSDRYSLVYGHHMDYGKMFGALDDFLEGSYLAEHSRGELIVGRKAERSYDIEVFAAMKVSAAEKIIFDIRQDEIQQFIEKNKNITTKKDSRILGLSTCADAETLDRIVVFCYINE